MPSKKSEKLSAADMETFLGHFTTKIVETKSVREGAIIFRLTGDINGDYHLDCSKQQVRLASEAPSVSPLIEVMGDAKRIRAILEGKKDGRAQFLAGGICVRGDLRYLSELALELRRFYNGNR